MEGGDGRIGFISLNKLLFAIRAGNPAVKIEFFSPADCHCKACVMCHKGVVERVVDYKSKSSQEERELLFLSGFALLLQRFHLWSLKQLYESHSKGFIKWEKF